MSKYIVLGIDQGLASCGYGILQFERQGYTLKFDKVLKYGVIKTKSDREMGDRLEYLKISIEGLIEKYNPSLISCERLFVSSPQEKATGRRNKSASIVTTNMATAIIYLISSEKNIKLLDFVPSSIKKEITGSGRATKEEMMKAVPKLMNLEDNVIKIEHQADALAIGYTAAMRIDLKMLEEEQQKKLKELKKAEEKKLEKERKKAEKEQKEKEKQARKLERERKKQEKEAQKIK